MLLFRIMILTVNKDVVCRPIAREFQTTCSQLPWQRQRRIRRGRELTFRQSVSGGGLVLLLLPSGPPAACLRLGSRVSAADRLRRWWQRLTVDWLAAIGRCSTPGLNRSSRSFRASNNWKFGLVRKQIFFFWGGEVAYIRSKKLLQSSFWMSLIPHKDLNTHIFQIKIVTKKLISVFLLNGC